MEVYGTTFWDQFWQIAGPTLLVLVTVNILLSIFWLAKKHWILGLISSLITFGISWIYIWSISIIQFAISLAIYFRKHLKKENA
ncbi:MAG: hypothetical protein K0Q56_1437 [Sporolactobacillus laevolacticus]|jgi:hypothetical protein|nr:hypothetical protein [Sporolactobacillus laevolacticus]